MKRVLYILHGWLFWNRLKKKNKIDYDTVVLVLAAENIELDRRAAELLNCFIKKKNASKGVIIWSDERVENITNNYNGIHKCQRIRQKDLELLYDLYCFIRFFDNIAFTFTSKPSENMLEQILNNTDIDENDAVCLAIYQLRKVIPVKEMTNV